QSPLTLEIGSETVTLPDGTGAKHTLSKIVPNHAGTGAAAGGVGDSMLCAGDCRKSGYDIAGMNDKRAFTADVEDWLPMSTPPIIDDHPAIQLAFIFRAHDSFMGKENRYQQRMLQYLSAYLAMRCAHDSSNPYIAAQCKIPEVAAEVPAYAAEISSMTDDEINRQLDYTAAMAAELARKNYDALPASKKREFDRVLGINDFANPDIGDAITIVTGGLEYEEKTKSWSRSHHANQEPGRDSWNYHFANVLLKSGGDYVTLENFAGDPKDWIFQMYGSGDQSFHNIYKNEQAVSGK